jgi:hypothetical protein
LHVLAASFFQTYGFVAQEASEENEESAAAEAAAAAAASGVGNLRRNRAARRAYAMNMQIHALPV